MKQFHVAYIATPPDTDTADSKDFEEAKAEAWDKIYNEHLKGEAQWQPVSRKDVFDLAFKYGYQLGSHPRSKSQISEKILQAVSGYYGIAIPDILGRCRKKLIAEARAMAMYLLCRRTTMTTIEVGKVFERAHSTVSCAVSSFEFLVRHDKIIKRRYDKLLLILAHG